MKVTALWRHPLKSHGREPLERVTLSAGEAMPYDRTWAVAHDAAKADGSGWAACQNFSRGAKSPALMAITSTLDEASETLTLRHPDRPDLSVQPDCDANKLIAWVRPLVDASRAQPDRVLRLNGRGFTDSPFPSLSLCNHATHVAVESLATRPLQTERWRGNIWFDGAPAWAEFGWIGRDIQLGAARLRIEQRITRCRATTANTDTGERDVDTLAALNLLAHQDFGVYAVVIENGEVSVGDTMELI